MAKDIDAGLVSPRKRMAMGEGGDFGAENPFKDGSKTMREDSKAGPVGDAKRGAPDPVKHSRGKLPAQAEADHGPHGLPKAR